MTATNRQALPGIDMPSPLSAAPDASHPGAHGARNRSADIAKGLGILLVVFGHNWIVQHEPGALYRIIFSVHMPLFFFLSGMFLSPDKAFGTLLRQRSDSLLKPYVAVLLGLAIFHIVAGQGIGPGYLPGVAYATGQSLPWIPLWFLPHLFIAQLFALALLKTPYLRAAPQRLLALVLLMLPLGVALLRLGHAHAPMTLELLPGQLRTIIGLPWSLDLIVINAAFLLAGHIAAGWMTALDRQALSASLLAGLMFALLHLFFDDTLDLNERRYDSVLISSLAAFSGIALILGLSSLLSRLPRASGALAYLGTASLFIFIFHAVIQGRFTGFFQRQLPGSPDAGAWLGFFAGVFAPVLIFECCRRSGWLSAALLPRRSRA